MGSILRYPEAAARDTYDLVILGGGIYGAMLAMESSRRGLRSLLLEKQDFGSATSFNSLRILHGGLRYLQKLDLHRFRESVGERSWFLRNLPHHVHVLPCLMPLYGDGLHRPNVFRMALWLNDWLSKERNLGIRSNRQLASGKVIDISDARTIFPGVDTRGLRGAAVWYDACMPDSQRILMEMLRYSCTQGAVCLNYVEGLHLLKSRSQVEGVVGYDSISGDQFEFRAKVVINACGPWSRQMAEHFDRDLPDLFHASIAWNVLLDREPLSDHALAVKPRKPNGRIYFLVPWKGRIMAGTGHAPWGKAKTQPIPSNEQLETFITDLNDAIPGFNLEERNIVHVLAGLLPAVEAGTDRLAVREVIFDHGANGGPQGLYSLSGVKFTTSRLVAQKTIERIFGDFADIVPEKSTGFEPADLLPDSLPGVLDKGWSPSKDENGWDLLVHRIIEEEAVQHLDDLLFRRTSLWSKRDEFDAIAKRLCGCFDWDEARCRAECSRSGSFYYPRR